VLVEAFRQALRTLWGHRLRSALTLFGFVWGTAAVIFLVGWGDGLSTMLERGFSKTGRDMGALGAGRISEDFSPVSDRRWLWLGNEDLAAARRRATLAEIVAGESGSFLLAGYGARTLSADVRGVEPETLQIRGVPVVSGRGITRTDLDHRRRVAVVGDAYRRELLGAHGGVGSYIRVQGTPFEVVGVLAPVGIQLNRDGNLIDQQIWVPLTTFQALWPPPWAEEPVVQTILYRMPRRELYEETRDELRAILADRLGVSADDPEAVSGWSPVEILNRIPVAEVRGMMFLIAVATLGIGGVGVLNMMLETVVERRQEIGIRMAVGGRRRDVLWMFFMETLAVSFVGGGAGVALGVASCLLLGRLDVPDVVPVPELSAGIVLVAVGVMAAVGALAGLVPAWRATRVDPAVTLRME